MIDRFTISSSSVRNDCQPPELTFLGHTSTYCCLYTILECHELSCAHIFSRVLVIGHHARAICFGWYSASGCARNRESAQWPRNSLSSWNGRGDSHNALQELKRLGSEWRWRAVTRSKGSERKQSTVRGLLRRVTWERGCAERALDPRSRPEPICCGKSRLAFWPIAAGAFSDSEVSQLMF